MILAVPLMLVTKLVLIPGTSKVFQSVSFLNSYSNKVVMEFPVLFLARLVTRNSVLLGALSPLSMTSLRGFFREV